MLERLDNTITQITAVHAPVIALFRYFVICAVSDFITPCRSAAVSPMIYNEL